MFLVEALIVIAIVGILAVIVIQSWNNRNDPKEILNTNDWICLKTEPREYTYPMIVGKVTIMQTGTKDECVQWKRRDS